MRYNKNLARCINFVFLNYMNSVAAFKRVNVGCGIRKIDVESVVGWKNNHYHVGTVDIHILLSFYD